MRVVAMFGAEVARGAMIESSVTVVSTPSRPPSGFTIFSLIGLLNGARYY